MGRMGLFVVSVLFVVCRPDADPPVTPSPSGAAATAPRGEAPAAVEVARSDPDPGPDPGPAAAPTPPQPSPVPAPTMIGTADLWRESKSGGPPWSRVEIFGARFGLRPAVGEAVTILPRHPTLPVLELSITKVKTHGSPRDDIPRWWEPVLEDVTEPAYVDLRTPRDRSPQHPIDVVVVYPATPSATLLDPKRIDPDDLPPEVVPKGVEIAIDVDGDGRPDALEASVCSDDPKRARCFEATAWEIHRREGDGWQLVHRFEPAT